MTEPRLYAVPQPEFLEAPTSWLIRVAASQAVSVRHIGRFLGFKMERDCDAQIVSMDLNPLVKVAGIPDNAFEDVRHMLHLAPAFRMKSPVLLGEQGLPRYRFCGECLKTMVTPYLPIHWRVDAYRSCMTHECILEDHCPHCGATVCPQSNAHEHGALRSAVSMISQCEACSRFLWESPALKIKAISHKLLSREDRKRLKRGRALVEILFHCQVKTTDPSFIDIRDVVERSDRWGMLASGDRLTAASLRKMEEGREHDAS